MGTFIGWARRFYEWDGFDKEERDYKLRIAEQFARTRAELLRDWSSPHEPTGRAL